VKYKKYVTIKLMFSVYGTGNMSVAWEQMFVKYVNQIYFNWRKRDWKCF